MNSPSATTYLHILGRQPAIGLAELEARFGVDSVRSAGLSAALAIHSDPSCFDQLGGTVKAGELIAELPAVSWDAAIRYIERDLPRLLSHLPPEGKIKFGISAYDIKVRSYEIKTAGLHLKKIIKSSGRSVRIVPNQDAALSSAQTLHNQLTGPLGIELILVRHDQKILLARAVHVQNIDSYTLRDRGRPKRDTFIGMLPPKLAQIILNLAAGQVENQKPGTENSERKQLTILDPFCGTGVVLQEALLMGFSAYGTDVSEKMIDYTKENLKWLTTFPQFPVSNFQFRAAVADATTATWQQPIDSIAAETYLGAPLKAIPSPAELERIMRDCDNLHRTFLKNLAPQISPGIRLCLAIPAWNIPTPNSQLRTPSFRHLPVIDDLPSLGYNRVDFKHVRTRDLIYHREDQLVARELLVLNRI